MLCPECGKEVKNFTEYPAMKSVFLAHSYMDYRPHKVNIREWSGCMIKGRVIPGVGIEVEENEMS